jgi:hypothetical protein
MPDPENPAGPEEQPVIAGADDVDRLLEEAQSLANQIATGTGTADGSDQTVSPSAELTAEAKDALGATEEVEKTLAELEGMLGGEAAKPDAGAETAEDSLTVSMAAEASAQPQTERVASCGNNEILDLPADAEYSGEVDVDLGDNASGGSPSEAAAKEGRKPGASEKRSARALLTSVLSAGRQTAMAIAGFFPKMLMGIATVLDWPFARVSPTVKQCIGYVAIITILAAIASFVVPPLFAHNPYLKIGAPVEEAPAPAAE